MKLVDFICDIENADVGSVIFQADREDFNSEIILSFAGEDDGGVKDEGGKRYYYLIEVFLAKEFIDDWIGSLNYVPTSAEIARRLYDYAINDA